MLFDLMFERRSVFMSFLNMFETGLRELSPLVVLTTTGSSYLVWLVRVRANCGCCSLDEETGSSHNVCMDTDSGAGASSDSRSPTQWLMMDDWHNLAYEELSSIKDLCVVDLVDVLVRVRGMSAISTELADRYEAPRIFLEECLKFLALSKEDVQQLSKNKCFILMRLIKSFLAHFKLPLHTYEHGKHLFSLNYLSQMLELQQYMKIEVPLNYPSLHGESEFSSSACRSQWVRLKDWHDEAHRELLSIKHAYSGHVFKVYERVCSLSSKNEGLAVRYEAVKIFLQEYCKFLTLSRSDIFQLSRGECYIFLMLIKNEFWHQLLPPCCHCQLSIKVENPGLPHEFALSNREHLIEPDWLTTAHQELKSLRNLYSSQLDKLYENVYRLWSQSLKTDTKHDLTKITIERALSFLSSSRAEIGRLSKAEFKEKLKRIAHIMKDPLIIRYQSEKVPEAMNTQSNPILRSEASKDTSHFVQSQMYTNLNDQTYEELQLAMTKYYPILLTAYKLLRGTRLFEDRCRKTFDSCFKFLESSRYALGLWPRGHFETMVKKVEAVARWSKKELALPRYRVIKQLIFRYREIKGSDPQFRFPTSSSMAVNSRKSSGVFVFGQNLRDS